MTKERLNAAVASAKNDIRAALQTVYDALNQGQQKQIVKDEAVKELFDRYGVNYGNSQGSDDMIFDRTASARTEA